MMFNLITKTLYQKRRFTVGWMIGLAAMSLFMITLFPTLQKSEIGQIKQSLPPALQKITGSEDTFRTVDMYITGELFALRIPLLFIILSIILFVGLTVSDERRGVLATQLSLPLSRTHILGSKLIAALVIMTLAAAGMIVGVLLGAAIIGQDVNVAQLLRHTLGCLLLALNFGLIVFLLGGGYGRRGAAMAIATAIAFASFLVSSLVAIAAVLEPIEKLSLFHYYQNPSPVSTSNLVLLAAIGAITSIVAFIAFRRRDIGV